ncbi:MAG: glycogen debranching enzyme, partial [Spartobacteria bacterium]|nr:glycogen debranching enzyme [Spartobacteria bacterium]
PLANAIIYEAHIRGYTVHPSAGVQHPGTYRGFIEKIPYIKELGVTSVEFLPMQEFNEMEFYTENMGRRDLRNFWGYSTQAFFAPMSRFAADGVAGQQIREFRELVTALHREGIEVILDIVFNHTCEGNMDAATYSMRGIDNPVYYMMEDNGKHYRNYSGCGNTVNCNHPVVRQFILDCLRYWVLHMHVDGFRFDLASVLTRGQHGEILPNPPLIEAIAEDPVLRHTKLIAEAWDAAGLYQVGSFPNRHWSEWNGKYRDHMRRFWKGEEGMLRAFVTHLVGSPDLYGHEKQTPQKSINFITAHDGFTMYDAVSYLEKRNQANHENNADGERFNESQNCGVEGETDNPTVLAKRKRQQKNFFATLLLSQGVPMLLAGDEFSRTQKGNNNAYCQDNDISWVDWSLLDTHRDLFEFVKTLIAFRKAQPALRRDYFLNDQTHGDSQPDVLWFGPTKTDIDWDHGKSIACFLSGNIDHNTPRVDDDLFIIFNASEHPRAFMPIPSEESSWSLALTTQDTPPSWRKGQKTIKVDEFSVNVLVRNICT